MIRIVESNENTSLSKYGLEIELDKDTGLYHLSRIYDAKSGFPRYCTMLYEVIDAEVETGRSRYDLVFKSEKDVYQFVNEVRKLVYEGYDVINEFYDKVQRKLNSKGKIERSLVNAGEEERIYMEIDIEGYEFTFSSNLEYYSFNNNGKPYISVAYWSDNNSAFSDSAQLDLESRKFNDGTSIDSRIEKIKDIINRENNKLNRSDNYQSGSLDDLSEVFGQKITRSYCYYNKLTSADVKLLASILKHYKFKLVFAGGYETKETYSNVRGDRTPRGRVDRAQVVFSDGNKYLEFNHTLDDYNKVRLIPTEPKFLRTPNNNYTWDFSEYGSGGEESRIDLALYYCNLEGIDKLL